MPDLSVPDAGSLTQPVIFNYRSQTAIAGGQLNENLEFSLPVYAKIEPVGTANFLMGFLLDDNSISHRIWVRYTTAAIKNLSQFEQISVTTPLPDGSGTWTQVFRVRRWNNWQGKKEFICIEVAAAKTNAVSP
jgi:head-tail adaptor